MAFSPPPFGTQGVGFKKTFAGLWSILVFLGMVIIPWGAISWLFERFLGNLYIAKLIPVHLSWGEVFWMITPIYLPVIIIGAIFVSGR